MKAFLREMMIVRQDVHEALTAHHLHGDAIRKAVSLVRAVFVQGQSLEKLRTRHLDHSSAPSTGRAREICAHSLAGNHARDDNRTTLTGGDAIAGEAQRLDVELRDHWTRDSGLWARGSGLAGARKASASRWKP